MRSLPTRIRYLLAKASLLCHARGAHRALAVATLHAEVDGMVDAVRGFRRPPFLLRGEPALCQAWRNGQHVAHCLSDSASDDGRSSPYSLHGDSYERA